VASIEIGEPTSHLRALYCPHWDQLICLD
jgi:hypothetical protein